jgi:ABC-type transporter Mla subunit MlaD
MVPAGEIRDLTAAANQTSADMAATATEVVSLEQAVQCSPQARAYLTPTINAFTEQLNTGLHQYSEMVSAAAQLVSSARGQSMSAAAQYRDESAGAADRLAGWAQAFEELGRLPRA